MEFMGIRGKKAGWLLALSSVWAVVFLVSGFLLIRGIWQDRRQQETFDALRGRLADGLIWETCTDQGNPDRDISLAQRWKAQWEDGAEERLKIYRSLKMDNPDMAGWVKIEGTRIDYPVMHSPGREDYYLNHDFYGRDSNYGTPFLMEQCRYESPRTSLLISGHHMKNGAMFAQLQDYRDQEFWEEHPFVQFDTAEEAGSYEVAAVIAVSASGDSTVWQSLLFPKGKEEFNSAWEQVKELWFYDTGVELLWGDELLALATCEYTVRDGRLLVIARRIV